MVGGVLMVDVVGGVLIVDMVGGALMLDVLGGALMVDMVGGVLMVDVVGGAFMVDVLGSASLVEMVGGALLPLRVAIKDFLVEDTKSLPTGGGEPGTERERERQLVELQYRTTISLPYTCIF